VTTQYRLLVLDIDGTLIGKSGRVSPENKEALVRAAGLGVTVSLCTGRSLNGCLPLLAELSLNGSHIFFDGALVFKPSTGHEIYAQEIEIESTRKAVDWARRQGMDIELYSSNAYFAEHENWSTATQRKYFNTVARFVKFEDIIGRERLIKLGVMANNDNETRQIEDFCREFQGVFNFSWVTSPSFPDTKFVNILSPKVSKGGAVAELASFLNIPREAIMAIGDGTNDISMIATAGAGVAMGQSPDEVKSAAGYITDDVEKNGLASAIEKFLLG
jgi:5-amino-6-(5-phospho-D-ribitylamino)uracil phosphatase